MAERFVALVRGVNVGKAARVAMADLRSLASGLGFTEVSTLLNSGNLVFAASDIDATGVARLLETALDERLGLPVRVTVRTAREVADVVRANPLVAVADDPSRLLVAFLAEGADPRRLDSVAAREWAPEAFAAGEREAYLWCPGGVADSPLVKAFEKAMTGAVTSRNWATVLRLEALAKG